MWAYFSELIIAENPNSSKNQNVSARLESEIMLLFLTILTATFYRKRPLIIRDREWFASGLYSRIYCLQSRPLFSTIFVKKMWNGPLFIHCFDTFSRNYLFLTVPSPEMDIRKRFHADCLYFGIVTDKFSICVCVCVYINCEDFPFWAYEREYINHASHWVYPPWFFCICWRCCHTQTSSIVTNCIRRYVVDTE